MNLHEYQGKEILNSFGVRIQRGIVANTPEEAVEAAKKLTEETGTGWHVIKAQVHAGGRGKGGGVKLAKNLDEVKSIADDILGMMLVTPQTSAEGKLVNQVLIAEDVYYPGDSEPDEFYMSVLLNRATGRNMIMYSTEGGMDIETVAEETPHLIFTEEIDPGTGLLPFQARKIAFNLGLYRHKDYAEMRDLREENPIEVEANAAGLNYVDLDGNVGCMVNGAGLAMGTMDLIKQAGGEPANFLDVGGTADAQRVETAFGIILKDPNVKAILVNIFGGIVRCDRVAQGIVDAYKNMGDKINVPIIARLQGTNAKEAKELIDNSGMEIISATEFQEAADKVQEVLSA